MASKLFSRISRSGITRRLILGPPRPLHGLLSNGFRSLSESHTTSPIKWVLYQTTQSLQHLTIGSSTLQRFEFSSSASPKPTENESGNSYREQGTVADQVTGSQNDPEDKANNDPVRATGDSTDSEDADLSIDDLVKLVAEKEELLKLKHKEIEKMQDKVLRSYAEMENVIDRTKREAENSKKFAIQNFAKTLLDVADNLGRASSSVKDGFSKIDPSKDSVGALAVLKSLLEGVEMTEKQLAEHVDFGGLNPTGPSLRNTMSNDFSGTATEYPPNHMRGYVKMCFQRITHTATMEVQGENWVFRKFGVEKFDPINEHFDPNRHYAVFQVPDASKQPGTVIAVLKSGYMLYDRIIRPAEVGVSEALNQESDEKSSS